MTLLRTVCITIPLKPEALKRPRVSFAEKRFYSTQEHERIALGVYLRQGMLDNQSFTRPLELTADFYFKRPRGKKHAKLVYVPSVPDLDNLLKMICDSAQDCGLFKNDSIVCSILSRKLYTDGDARTQLTIREIE